MKRSTRDVDGPTREAADGPTKRAKFAARTLLKVYLEAKDLERLTAAAREDRKLVGEYVRNLVLDDLNARDALGLPPVPESPDAREVELRLENARADRAALGPAHPSALPLRELRGSARPLVACWSYGVD